MKSKIEFRKHRVRFLSHSITAMLLCIAAFVWAPKNIYMSYALLCGAGIYGLAARKQLHQSEIPLDGPAEIIPPRFSHDIFKT